MKALVDGFGAEREGLWDAVKSKVPWFVFIPMVALFFAVIAWTYTDSRHFQLTVIAQLSETGKAVAVIQERVKNIGEDIKDHMESDKPKKR